MPFQRILPIALPILSINEAIQEIFGAPMMISMIALALAMMLIKNLSQLDGQLQLPIRAHD